MALTVLIDSRRRRHRGAELVSLSPKFKQVGLFKKSHELLKKHSDKGILTHVIVLTDDSRPNQFWVKPCESDTLGSVKVNSFKSATSFFIPILFDVLPVKPKETIHAKIEWDNEEGAARVDLGNFAKKVTET